MFWEKLCALKPKNGFLNPNAWLFTLTVKVKGKTMVYKKLCFVMLVITLALGMTVVGCGGAGGGGGDVPPEFLPDAERWNIWYAQNSPVKAKLESYSIDENGMVSITVGGVPEFNDETNGWNAWRVSAEYAYTIKAGKRYLYTFEAWTKEGTRNLNVQYYGNNDDSVYMGQTVPITTARKSYTIYGSPLPKSGKYNLSFQLADQIGTLYINSRNKRI